MSMLVSPMSTRNASYSGVLPTRLVNSPPDPTQALLGNLDRYRLSCLLGRGGMAEVFLAAWQVAPEVVRPVVVKRLYSHFSEDPSLVCMFIDEARLVCQLDHENIVKTYEVGLIDGHLCIAMEYLEGQTLQQVLRRGWDRTGVPAALSVHIATATLAALRFAHEATDRRGLPNEIVHRDISPQNIFLTNNGHVKVLDFGVAKAKSHEQRTSTGVVKGKFAYIAPEQAAGHSVDARADLWSLGVVLWEMLAGRRLFKADGEAATLNATLHRDIPFLSKVRPEIPFELSSCVARALQRDPAQRYADAASMLSDLEHCLARMDPRPDAAALADYMHELFADEIRSQHQLVSDLLLLHEAQKPTESLAPANTTNTGVACSSQHKLDDDDPRVLLTRLSRTNRLTMAALLGVGALLLVACFVLWNLRHGSMPSTQVPTALSPPAAKAADAPKPPTPVEATAQVGVAQRDTVTEAMNPETEPLPSAPPHQPELARPARRPAKSQRKAAASDSASPVEHPASATEHGYLTIDTTPWSSVTCRGKTLGQTPLMKVKLPTGAQVLTLRNPELGVELQYTVTIVADQTTVKRIGLK